MFVRGSRLSRRMKRRRRTEENAASVAKERNARRRHSRSCGKKARKNKLKIYFFVFEIFHPLRGDAVGGNRGGITILSYSRQLINVVLFALIFSPDGICFCLELSFFFSSTAFVNVNNSGGRRAASSHVRASLGCCSAVESARESDDFRYFEIIIFAHRGVVVRPTRLSRV